VELPPDRLLHKRDKQTIPLGITPMSNINVNVMLPDPIFRMIAESYDDIGVYER
jgi:hypothetical protein